jgi:hypothetical protein
VMKERNFINPLCPQNQLHLSSHVASFLSCECLLLLVLFVQTILGVSRGS